MGIKDIYFALEDRYYDAVEALHLNGLTDAIDRVVPSFAVLLVLLLLLFGGGAFFWWSNQTTAPPAPTAFSLTLTFTNQSKEAVANESVLITFADNTTQTFTTKTNGSILVKVKPAQSPIKISLNAAGFLPYSQEYAVTKNQSLTITLEGSPISLEGISRTILIQDEQGQLLGQTTPVNIVVKFSCSNNPASTPSDVVTTSGTVNVTAPGDCGRLTARVIASGYREKNAELFNSTTEMRLTPAQVQVQQGSIAIAVNRITTNAVIAGAQVRLYSVPTTGTAQLENQGITDAAGTYLFQNLNPGRYYITSTKAGFSLGQTPTSQLNAGQTLNLSLTLSTSNNNKKFYVKVQNSSGVAIPQAAVQGFLADDEGQFILYMTKFTDANGTITEVVGDINNTASAIVVTHPNYVTEIVNPATIVNATDTPPLVVVMESVTLGSNGIPTNAGNATVHVQNEINFPVQSANAKLFQDDVNGLLINAINTDSTGNALFKNLPADSYQARATKGSLSGNSAILSVSNAQNKVFPVTLSTNQGGVEVLVADAITLAPIVDANVQFFVIGESAVQFNKSTDAQGKASASFDANKVVYAKVSKSGYYTLTTSYTPILSGNIFTLPAALQSVGSVQGMELELLRIWNTSSPLTLTQSLQPGTSYLVEYRLTVPTGRNAPVRTHIRVGSEAASAAENTSSSQDEIEIDDVTTLYGVPELSPNFQPLPQDPFVTLPPIQNGTAKVANVNFGNVAGGAQYQYFAWVTVKPTAVNGQDVRFRFQAKDSGSLITPLHLRTFTIGQALPQNLYGFNFYLKLLGTTNSIQLPENGSTSIINQNIYQLDYTVTNFSASTYNASSNVQLQFLQSTQSLLLGGTSPPLSVSAIQIPIASLTPGQVVNGTIYVRANVPANGGLNGIVDVELLNVTGTTAQRKRTLAFTVVPAAVMNVNYSPPTLTPGLVENLSIGISDGNVAVQGTITLTLADPTNPSVNTIVANTPLLSNANGLTTIPIGPFTAGQSVHLSITAPNFVPYSAAIPVGAPLTGTQQFGCVTISNNPLLLSQGSGGQFSISTQNCAENVNIRLRGGASTNVTTIPGFGTVPTALPASGGSQAISVQSPSTVLGQFPVYVDAKFASQPASSFVEINEVKVLVQGLSNNCFSLTPTGGGLYEYTLAQGSGSALTATGNATNNCHIYVKDVKQPRFQLANEPTLLVNSSSTSNAFLFTPISSAWSANITAYGYAPAGGGSPPVPIQEQNQWRKYLTSSPSTYTLFNDAVEFDPTGDSVCTSCEWVYDAWYSNATALTIPVTVNVEDRLDILVDGVFLLTNNNLDTTFTLTFPAGTHHILIKLRDTDGSNDFLDLHFGAPGQKLSDVVSVLTGQNPAFSGGDTDKWMEIYTATNGRVSYHAVPDSITNLQANTSGDSGCCNWTYTTWYTLAQPTPVTVALSADDTAMLKVDGVTVLQDTSNGSTTATAVYTLPAGVHKVEVALTDGVTLDEVSVSFNGLKLSQVVDKMAMNPVNLGGAATGSSATDQWQYVPNMHDAPTLVNDTIGLKNPPVDNGSGDWDWTTFYYLPQSVPVTVQIWADNYGYLYLDDATGTNYLAYDYVESGNIWASPAFNAILPAGMHRLNAHLNDVGNVEHLKLGIGASTASLQTISQIINANGGQVHAYPDQFLFGAPPSAPLSTIASDTGTGNILPNDPNPIILSTLAAPFQFIQNNGIVESAIPDSTSFVSGLTLTDVPATATDVHTFIRHEHVYGQYIGNEPNDNGNLAFTIQSNGASGQKYVTLDVEDYVRPVGALPTMKLIAVIDASPSFQSYYSTACAAINSLRSNLKTTLYAGQPESAIETKIYYLGNTTVGVVGPGCAINNMPQIPNSTIQALGNTWALGTAHPYDSLTDSYEEAWGNGITQALNQFPLTNATTNVLMLFTDSDPTGSKNTATGTNYWRADESAIASSVATAMNTNNVHGFAFYGVPETNSMNQVAPTNQLDVINVLDTWATSTDGFVEALESQSMNYPSVTQRMLRSIYGTQTQQFSVKVIGPSTGGGGTSNLCYGPENQVGITNAVAIPKVSFEWRFQDFPSDGCNATNANGVYCDGVQFMISLYKKLNTLHANATAGNLSQVPALTQFQARMIQDGFTQDLNADFLRAYSSGGALNNVLQWFVGAPSSDVNFSRYVDEGRVTIDVNVNNVLTNTLLPSSGTYDVKLTFEWDNPQAPYVFFNSSAEPIGRVHVTLTKVPNSEQGLDSPLYFIPFDGMVGYDATTNTFQRQGYGMDYVGDLIPIKLGNNANEITETYPTTQGGNAFGVITTSKQETFAQTNLYRRGKLFSIDRTAGVLTYSPSNATPVWTRFVPLNNELHNNFYWVTEAPLVGGTASFIGAPVNTITLNPWKAFASTSTITNPSNAALPYCASLTGTLLPTSINDATAASYGANNYCSLVSTTGLNSSLAFGFSYNAQPSTGYLGYRSVFYTPTSKKYTLGPACNNWNNQGNFYTPNGLVGQTGHELVWSTDQSDWSNGPEIINSAMSIARIFNLVQNGFLCVSSSAQQLDVFWNENLLLQQLQTTYGTSGFPSANSCQNP